MQHGHEESQGAYQPQPEQQSFTSTPDSGLEARKRHRGRNWLITIVSAVAAAIAAYTVFTFMDRDKSVDLEYTYSTAEFSIDFPGEPKMDTVPGVDGNSVPIAAWEHSDDTAFMAAYSPLMEPGVSIEESVMGAFIGAEGTLEDLSDFPIEGGRGVLGKGVNDVTGGKMWALAVFVEGDDGVFTAMHIGEEEMPEFFDSFEISDEFMESVGK